MRNRYNLAELSWTLSGWAPHHWRLDTSMELGNTIHAELPGLHAPVPGSVQEGLRLHNLLPDWNVGLHSRDWEWVENRHWRYEAFLPNAWISEGTIVRLVCLGLDDRGWIFLNGQEVGTFNSAFTPHIFNLTPYLHAQNNRLAIIFDCPPRALGQIGYTSDIQDWKARFYYGWDWTPRLVQIGIWDEIFLETTDEQEIVDLRCTASADVARHQGRLSIQGLVRGSARLRVRLSLREEGASDECYLQVEEITPAQLAAGVEWMDLPVALWWPNKQGEQPLYHFSCQLVEDQPVLDEVPGTLDNLFWRRSSWWIEWPEFVVEHGREPHDLEEFVQWSQQQRRSNKSSAKICTPLTRRRSEVSDDR